MKPLYPSSHKRLVKAILLQHWLDGRQIGLFLCLLLELLCLFLLHVERFRLDLALSLTNAIQPTINSEYVSAE